MRLRSYAADRSTDWTDLIRPLNGNNNVLCSCFLCADKQRLNGTYANNFEKVLLNMHITVHANEKATSTHQVHHHALLTHAGNRVCTRDTTDVHTQSTVTHSDFTLRYLWLWCMRAQTPQCCHITHWQLSVDFLHRANTLGKRRHEGSCPPTERSTGSFLLPRQSQCNEWNTVSIQPYSRTVWPQKVCLCVLSCLCHECD